MGCVVGLLLMFWVAFLGCGFGLRFRVVCLGCVSGVVVMCLRVVLLGIRWCFCVVVLGRAFGLCVWDVLLDFL